MCKFRYLAEPEPNAVALQLFKDQEGRAFGEATGPVDVDAPSDRCIADLDTAFWAAIRIANAIDVEVVVSGDASLWRDEWGHLTSGTELKANVWWVPSTSSHKPASASHPN